MGRLHARQLTRRPPRSRTLKPVSKETCAADARRTMASSDEPPPFVGQPAWPKPLLPDLALDTLDSRPAPSNAGQSVFVGNVDINLENLEQLLTELFTQAGTVLQVSVPREKGGGRLRGFAFCDFADAASAQYAVAVLNGTRLGTRSIRLELKGGAAAALPPRAPSAPTHAAGTVGVRPGLPEPPRRAADGGAREADADRAGRRRSPPPDHRGYDRGPRGDYHGGARGSFHGPNCNGDRSYSDSDDERPQRVRRRTSSPPPRERHRDWRR